MERDERWIAEERRLWDAMMAPGAIVRRDRKWSALIGPHWVDGDTLYGSRAEAEAKVLAYSWRAYRAWLTH